MRLSKRKTFAKGGTNAAAGVVDVGIVVPAVGLDPAIVGRLIESIDEHESTRATYRVCIVDEKHPDADTFGDGANFNLAAAKNAGIRDFLRDGSARIIACTDADYIIPAGLVDFLAADTSDRHIWAKRRDVAPAELADRTWAAWAKLPCRDICLGSFNAMSADNWRKAGGWDERCVGYGGEDNVLHKRIAAVGIETIAIDGFPLIHGIHGRTERAFSRGQYRGDVNIRAAAAEPQLDFLVDNPPPRSKPPVLADGLTFAILTRDRADLFIETVLSFLEMVDADDLAKITKWTIYDHASPPAVRTKILDYFDSVDQVDFEMVDIPADLDYWQARQVMLTDIETPFAIFWEDDWKTYRPGPIISDAWAILNDRPATKCVTFRYWPARVIRSGRLAYRLHEYSGDPTGQKGYYDYYESHWPNFAWNPSLHDMAAVRSALPVDPRTERGMAERYLAAGYDMAYTLCGHVEHIGDVSALGKTRKIPNVKGK